MPEALPSLSTVKREAAKRYTPLIEGEFSFDQLVAHLQAYSACRVVSISKDATRVISRVEYDQTKDKLVGFVLPLDKDSLPLSGSFQATSLSAIEAMFEKKSFQYLCVHGTITFTKHTSILFVLNWY